MEVPYIENSSNGLKYQIEQIFEAIGSNPQEAKLLVNNLFLEDRMYFHNHFGAFVGDDLLTEYDEQGSSDQLLLFFSKLWNKKQTEVVAFEVDDRIATGLQKKAMNLMVLDDKLYTIKLLEPGHSSGMSMWSFVFCEGMFKFLGKMRAASK